MFLFHSVRMTFLWYISTSISFILISELLTCTPKHGVIFGKVLPSAPPLKSYNGSSSLFVYFVPELPLITVSMTLFSSGLGRTSLGVPYKDSTQLIITWVWRNLWIQCIEWYWNTNSSIARVSFENRIDAKSFLNSLARLRMNKWVNNSIINSGILMCQIFFL